MAGIHDVGKRQGTNVRVRQRLLSGMAATSFGYLVFLFAQFGSVPLLLSAWGPALYGEWIIASTIPGYLAMSDLGLGQALTNDMSLALGRGDRQEANTAFQSVGIALLFSVPLICLPLFVAIRFLPLGPAVGIHIIGERHLATLAAIFFVQVWAGQQINTLGAALRCIGSYPLVELLGNCMRLAEVAALMATASAGFGPIPAAVSMVSVRCAFALGMAMIVRRKVPWLRFGLAEATPKKVAALGKSGIGFLSLPIANALNIQTPVVIVGMLFGSSAVAAFSTIRTLSRGVQQLTNIVYHVVWFEMPLAYGASNMAMVRRLFRFSIMACLAVAVASSAALMMVGPDLYRFWTHRLVSFDRLLLALLLAVVIVNALWNSAAVILFATNRNIGLASANMLCNLAAVPLLWLLGQGAGVRGIAAGLILCDAAIAFYAVPASFRMAGDTLSGLLGTLASPRRLMRFVHGSSGE